MRMTSVRMISILLVGVLSTACRSTTAPFANVSVAVDSAVYHLKPVSGHYTITLTARITNGSDRDIYLSRFCPRTSLRRPDGHGSRLWFGQVACMASGSLSPPPVLILSPGSVHTESFTLIGSEQPQARPQITMEDLTGLAIFGFLASTDLRNFEGVMSPQFVLQGPT